MCIKRQVFDQLIARYPDLSYVPDWPEGTLIFTLRRVGRDGAYASTLPAVTRRADREARARGAGLLAEKLCEVRQVGQGKRFGNVVDRLRGTKANSTR
jgi:hypothetical protein